MFPKPVPAFTAAAVVTGSALALGGLVTTSIVVLITLALISLAVAPAVAMTVHSIHPDSARALRIGAACSAGTLAAGLLVAGLVSLLGPVAVLVILTLPAAAGIWVYRRGSSWPDRVGRTSPGRPGIQRSRWPHGPAVAPDSVHPTAPHVPLGLPTLDIATVSMPGLCAAWQRTYWLLSDRSLSSTARLILVELREELLEEFERRDPAGLRRWLHTEPRACSNPGRYLTTDH